MMIYVMCHGKKHEERMDEAKAKPTAQGKFHQFG